MWQLLEYPLDVFISSELDKELKKIRQVSIIGNNYMMESISFVNYEGSKQIVDDFGYSDSPANHGWVNEKPDAISPRIILDAMIEKRVMACFPGDIVNVEEGAVTEDIDFHLLKANMVSGRITDSEDGLPLADIHICAETENWSCSPWNYNSSSDVYTDQNGRYTLLVSGSYNPISYKIKVSDWVNNIYLEAYYPMDIDLTSGIELNGIDFSMKEGGELSGRVTFFESDIPAAGAFVECRVSYGKNYDDYDDYEVIGTGRTDSNGYYLISGISPGGYVLYAESGDGYFEGYYQDSQDYMDPPIVDLGEETTGMDIRLYPKQDGLNYSMPYQGISYSYQGGYGAYSSVYGAGYGSVYTSSSTQNVPPEIISEPKRIASVREVYTYYVSIEDPNQLENLTCRLMGAPSGMTTGEETWMVQWTPEPDQVGHHLVKICVDASSGGVARQDFVIQVVPYMVIESAEGDESPLLNGEWHFVEGTGIFTHIYDDELQSRVLKLNTDEPDPLDCRIQYPIGSSLQNPRPYMCFAVRDDNDFHFCVSVKAGGSDYILHYVPMDGNYSISWNQIIYYIGNEYQDGHWYLCRRDLQKDLEPVGATFEWVNHFEVWGDCRMDDLWLSYQPIDYQIFSLMIHQGLNIISLPIKSSHMDSDDLYKLIMDNTSGILQLRRRNAFMGRWERDFGAVRDDQGFVIYSTEENWLTLKGTEKKLNISTLGALLKTGTNLVSPPSPDQKSYNADDLLKRYRGIPQGIPEGIHEYDHSKGRWQSKYRFFGRSNGPNFKAQEGKGYIIDLSKD